MKWNIYTGKNGCGKTKKIFNEFQNKTSRDLNVVEKKYELIMYKMLIPSVRIMGTDSYDKYELAKDEKEEYHSLITDIERNKTLSGFYTIWYSRVNYYIELAMDKLTTTEIERMDNILVGLSALCDKREHDSEEYVKGIREMNDGLKSFLSILGVVYECKEICSAEGIGGKIYIDEIENHAYPKLIKLMIDKIAAELSELDVEIIFSTHSPIAVMAHELEEYSVCNIENDNVVSNQDNARFLTYSEVLEILFEMKTPKSDDEIFFNLVNKYMFKELDEEDKHKFIRIKSYKKQNDKPFYDEYEVIFEEIGKRIL